MEVRQLQLHNFRNFQEVEAVEFPERAFLVAAAPNATGKTNFLEAISVLLRGKSWRAPIEECVRWKEEGFVLKGIVERKGEEMQLAVRYHKPKRKLRIEEDDAPVSPVVFYTHYPFVLFLPEDTFLWQRGPAERRTFLNHVLVSTSTYLSALVQYNRVLKRRNALLKSAQSYTDIEAWSELLVEHGTVLWGHREGLAQFLSANLPEMYERLSGEKLAVGLRLVPGARRPEQLGEHLRATFSDEQRVGFTLAGPHRDDLVATVEGRPAGAVLSRGQLRSLVIAVKILAHQYLTKNSQDQPLLLLDDVLSELDERRQTALLKNLPATQTLLTCTRVPAVLERRADVHLLDLRSILARQPERPTIVERDEKHVVPKTEPEAAVPVATQA